MLTTEQFSTYSFECFDDIPFNPKLYSDLKFGSTDAAKSMGIELADAYFKKHSEKLKCLRSVVIPSPFNVVPNAASLMAGHFYNRINHLLVQSHSNRSP